MRDVMRENAARDLFCPLRAAYCRGDACMAWVISWENNNEGCCGAFRPSYEQEIGEGWKKYGRRIMDTQKKLRARMERAEADLRAKEKEEYRIFQELKQLSDVAERLPVLLRKAEQERDAARTDLERAQAEAAAMRAKIEAAIKHFSALHVEGGGAGVVDELLLEALSSQAGADLLAELARLREVERLAKGLKAEVSALNQYRERMAGIPTDQIRGWHDEYERLLNNIRTAEANLFEALGKEAAE